MSTVELAFERFGENDGCPLIILHGFLAAARNWRTVAKQLAQQRTVYVLDMRNHGNSPHHTQMDYPTMADDVLAFMNQHDLPQAHLLGHSMGGKAAMCFALQHAQRVKQLVVVDIAPVSYSHSFDGLVLALKQLPLAELGNRKQAEQLLADAIPDLSFRQFLLQNLLLQDGVYYWRINLDIIQQTAANIVGFPPLSVAEYAQKALFVAGEHSNYINADAVQKWFPQAQISEIANTGHWLYVEAPQRFCELVNAWLSQP